MMGPSPMNPWLAVFSWQLLNNYKRWISIYSPGIRSDIPSWHKWVSIAVESPGIVYGIEHQRTERNRPVQSHLEYEIWIELINEKVEVLLQGWRWEDGGRGTPVSGICCRVLFILPLSYFFQKLHNKTKLNHPQKPATPRFTLPPHRVLPWNTAREPLSADLAGGCGALLSVPLTSILSVKSSIPWCWKQQFAKQAGLESCLTKRQGVQKGKFKLICLSNFLKDHRPNSPSGKMLSVCTIITSIIALTRGEGRPREGGPYFLV